MSMEIPTSRQKALELARRILAEFDKLHKLMDEVLAKLEASRTSE